MATSRTLKLSILADVDDLNKKLKAANNDVEDSSNKLGEFGKKAGLAFAAAAAAAGAYAIKIGVDGVKAAIEDQQAQIQLANALEKATGATEAQIAATEKSIDQMARATGVSDEKLRPALQRLSISTNDISKAQDLLAIALDVSTATGKPLEGVANALGKAYDGNTAALGKLGVGLSSAELKSMSFEEVTKRLTDTFGGAAAANADTYAGRIARVQVAFDEAKETIGNALLPVLEKLLGFVTSTVLPVFDKLSGAVGGEGLGQAFEYVANVVTKVFVPVFNGVKSAFNSITDAISDNKASFIAFGKIIAEYVAPVIGTVFGGALKVVGAVAGGIINIIADIAGVIAKIVGGAIDGINAIIKAYNAIPVLPNIPTIPKPSISIPQVQAPSSNVSVPKIPTVAVPTISGGGGSTGGGGGTSSAASSAASASASMGTVVTGSFNVGGFRAAEAASMAPTQVVVNVNAPSVIDEEGFSRAVVDALNQSTYRGTGGSRSFAVL